jgi:hypothetical protein
VPFKEVVKVITRGNLKVRRGQKALLFSAFIVVTVIFTVFNVSCQAPSSAPTPAPAPSPTTGAWSADGVITDGEYSRQVMCCVDLGAYYDNDEQYIYMGLKGKTNGWVAVGVQPGSGMADADIIFCLVKDGETIIYDQFGSGAYNHSLDTELGGTDDILEFGGKEEGEWTVIEFKRALDTGDEYDHPLIKGEDQVIWAFSPDEELTTHHLFAGYWKITIE